MIYTKLKGSVCDSYYAIDEENTSVAVVEIYYHSVARATISDYRATYHSAHAGTYDTLAVEGLKECDKITKKEWLDVKKDFADYIKYLETFKE